MYPDNWGSIKWSAICSSTENTSKIKPKPIHVILGYPSIFQRSGTKAYNLGKKTKEYICSKKKGWNRRVPTYQCLKLSSTSSITTGWLQFNVFPGYQQKKIIRIFYGSPTRKQGCSKVRPRTLEASYCLEMPSTV